MTTHEPTPLDLDRVPAAIREGRRCVLWNYEMRAGKLTKVPYQPEQPTRKARSDAPRTWGTFALARQGAETGKSHGLGFMLGDGFAGVDLDDCRDPHTGALTPEANAIIRELNSYTEVSPSGTGVKIYLRGTLPPGRRRKGKYFEMYDGTRFFALTGWHIEGTPRTLEERTAELAELHARIFRGNGKAPRPATGGPAAYPLPDDTLLLDRARRAKDGEKFSRLWAGDISGHPSQSEADLAFCNLLGFWTGRDAARMDRLFRQSGLMRPKWDERRGPQSYGERTIARAIEDGGETYRGPTSPRGGTSPGPAPSKAAVGEFRRTDMGNAERLVARFGEGLRYCFPRSMWLTWEGTHWQRDQTNRVEMLGKLTVREIIAEAVLADGEKFQEIAKHAARSEGRERLQAMAALARSEPGIPVLPEELDRDPWLLNVRNGTLDLRTGTLRPHDRADLITRVVPVDYSPEAACPLWTAFLDRAMGGNAELTRFLQRALGYSLTGDTQEQCLFFNHGKGANGKSTFIETISGVLGPYMRNTRPETFMMKQTEAINNDLAILETVRLVAAVELEEDRRLAEVLVKTVTGCDTISARYLYQEYFEYRPAFKLWLSGNHKPVIRGTDHAIWRRIRLIPWTVTISAEEDIKGYSKTLLTEAPGILAWAVRGCLDWQRDGLKAPAEVTDATARYRKEEDILGDFFAECVVVGKGDYVSVKDLFAAYVKFSEENGEGQKERLGKKRFNTRIRERGFDSYRATDHALTWIGLRLG